MVSRVKIKLKTVQICRICIEMYRKIRESQLLVPNVVQRANQSARTRLQIVSSADVAATAQFRYNKITIMGRRLKFISNVCCIFFTYLGLHMHIFAPIRTYISIFLDTLHILWFYLNTVRENTPEYTGGARVWSIRVMRVARVLCNACGMSVMACVRYLCGVYHKVRVAWCVL